MDEESGQDHRCRSLPLPDQLLSLLAGLGEEAPSALRPVLSSAHVGYIRARIAVHLPRFQGARGNIREARDHRGGRWSLICVQGRRSLTLLLDAPPEPAAHVVLPQDVASRLFTKGLDREGPLFGLDQRKRRTRR